MSFGILRTGDNLESMKKIFMFVNVDWFFLSHRLPVAKAAKKNNIDLSVYSEFTKSHAEKEIDGFNFLESPLSRSSTSILHSIFEFFQAYKMIKRAQPDLIHAVTIKPILALGIIARLTSTPFIGSISGLGPAFSSDTLLKRIRLWVLIRILRFIFDRNEIGVICQNTSDSQVLLSNKVLAKEKILMIPGSGVDIDEFSPLKKVINSEKYILMSSRILFDKGIQEYCEAAEIVKRAIKDDVKFKLSGPIDSISPTSISKSELENLVEKYDIDYLGDNRIDMPGLMASASLFVLPSYYPEGLPKVLLEAAASGVPVITTDHPGCRDAITNQGTGLLVPIKDSKTLAQAIIELISDESLSKHMGKQGRLLAEKSFQVSSVVDYHYSLYRRLL
jgi:glycosyltransferase involved in cell wall biosynthesis